MHQLLHRSTIKYRSQAAQHYLQIVSCNSLFCLQYNIYFFVFIAATAVPPATTTTASPDYTDELVTEEPETSCTAIRSGDFNDQNTWENGQIPSGLCSIIISAGKTVTFSNAEFDIEVPRIRIYGTLIFSSTTTITFKVIINIIVEIDGLLLDQTSEHKWYLLSGSLCTFYSDLTLIDSNTTIYQYTSVSGNVTVGGSYSLTHSKPGPFTFGILPGGEIEAFESVTYIVKASGSFYSSATWLGGRYPRGDICDSVGGCGLYIPHSCDLSTEDLDDELDIYFKEITVAIGGIFSLGRSGRPGGFRFKYQFRFNIFGTISFLSSSGSLYLPWGCAFNFYDGAHFTSTYTVSIRSYDLQGDLEGSEFLQLSSSVTTAYYYWISISGTVTQSTERKILHLIIFFFLT